MGVWLKGDDSDKILVMILSAAILALAASGVFTVADLSRAVQANETAGGALRKHLLKM